MVIYKTQSWSGYGKQNSYWNEYRLEGNTVNKYKCNRFKSFDSDGSYWVNDEKLLESWNINDPNLPDWLKQYIN